jgi:hypothetical protein
MAFQVATLRDLERHRESSAAVAGRFRRAASLVLLGYLLHAPWPLDAGSVAMAGALEQAFAADALQCIGVCLAALEALALALPSGRAVELACGVLGAAVLALSPMLTRLDPAGPFLPVLDYLTPRGGSQFPLFPWAGHVLLGVALSRVLLGGRRRFLRLLVGAGLFKAAAWVAAAGGAPLVSDHLGRLGWVLVGLGLLSLVEPLIRRDDSPLSRLSRETLFIYAFHVLLVYGRGVGLAALIGPRLSPLPAIMAALCMIGLSFGCARVYRWAAIGLARKAATG